MEESYETFEEELRPPRAVPPPQKPVPQILRTGGDEHTNTHTHTVHIYTVSVMPAHKSLGTYIVRLYK